MLFRWGDRDSEGECLQVGDKARKQITGFSGPGAPPPWFELKRDRTQVWHPGLFFQRLPPSPLAPSPHLNHLPWPSPAWSPGPIPLLQSPKELAAEASERSRLWRRPAARPGWVLLPPGPDYEAGQWWPQLSGSLSMPLLLLFLTATLCHSAVAREAGSGVQGSTMVCQRSQRSSGLELGQKPAPWLAARTLHAAPCRLVQSWSAWRLLWPRHRACWHGQRWWALQSPGFVHQQGSPVRRQNWKGSCYASEEGENWGQRKARACSKHLVRWWQGLDWSPGLLIPSLALAQALLLSV